MAWLRTNHELTLKETIHSARTQIDNAAILAATVGGFDQPQRLPGLAAVLLADGFVVRDFDASLRLLADQQRFLDRIDASVPASPRMCEA